MKTITQKPKSAITSSEGPLAQAPMPELEVASHPCRGQTRSNRSASSRQNYQQAQNEEQKYDFKSKPKTK